MQIMKTTANTGPITQMSPSSPSTMGWGSGLSSWKGSEKGLAANVCRNGVGGDFHQCPLPSRWPNGSSSNTNLCPSPTLNPPMASKNTDHSGLALANLHSSPLLHSVSDTLRSSLSLLHPRPLHMQTPGCRSLLNSYTSIKALVPKSSPLKILLGISSTSNLSLCSALTTGSWENLHLALRPGFWGLRPLWAFWMWADTIRDLRAHSSAAQQAQREHIGGQAPGPGCQSLHTVSGPQDGRCVAALRSEPQCRVGGPPADVSAAGCASAAVRCPGSAVGTEMWAAQNPAGSHWAPESWHVSGPQPLTSSRSISSGLPSGVRN